MKKAIATIVLFLFYTALLAATLIGIYELWWLLLKIIMGIISVLLLISLVVWAHSQIKTDKASSDSEEHNAKKEKAADRDAS